MSDYETLKKDTIEALQELAYDLEKEGQLKDSENIRRCIIAIKGMDTDGIVGSLAKLREELEGQRSG